MKAFTALALASTVLAIPSTAFAVARVSSNSNCPSSDAISLRLMGLLPAGGPERASARVRSEGDSLRIEVSTPGEESRQRTVEATGDCDARAEMAAFIIAAWLDVMPVGSFSTPGIPPREAKPMPRGRRSADDDPDAERLSFSTRTLVGGGIFGQVDGLGSCAGLAASVGMPNVVENVGWLLEVSRSSARQMEVGQGTAHIQRPTIALSATFELYRRDWLVRAQVGPALGVLQVYGTNYDVSESDTTVMWGVDVGCSLVRPWQGHELWIRLDANAWPQGRSILSAQGTLNPPIIAPLPSWEVRSLFGFSFGIL
jgi:hypothetical protein